jgi:hypothetical protein
MGCSMKPILDGCVPYSDMSRRFLNNHDLSGDRPIKTPWHDPLTLELDHCFQTAVTWRTRDCEGFLVVFFDLGELNYQLNHWRN